MPVPPPLNPTSPPSVGTSPLTMSDLADNLSDETGTDVTVGALNESLRNAGLIDTPKPHNYQPTEAEVSAARSAILGIPSAAGAVGIRKVAGNKPASVTKTTTTKTTTTKDTGTTPAAIVVFDQDDDATAPVVATTTATTTTTTAGTEPAGNQTVVAAPPAHTTRWEDAKKKLKLKRKPKPVAVVEAPTPTEPEAPPAPPAPIIDFIEVPDRDDSLSLDELLNLVQRESDEYVSFTSTQAAGLANPHRNA